MIRSLSKSHKHLFPNNKLFINLRSPFSTQSQTQAAKILSKYYKKNQLLPGHCNPQFSLKYKTRFTQTSLAHPNFFNQVKLSPSAKPIHLSSIGIGTQNGSPTPQDDYKMAQVLTHALTNGINYIDTDINFRYGKSQKVINATLNYLINQKDYKREEFFITTKFGYVPTDVDSDLTPEKLIEILKNQKFIQDENIVQKIYGWGQGFIEFCVEKSRLSLGVQTIDCLFMNNFSQAQLDLLDKAQYQRRLKATFKKLQEVRQSRRIKNYGMCSFVGWRSPPDEKGVHVNLQSVCNLVKDTVGSDHGFKFIMLPMNLGMPESLLKWQKYQQQGKQSLMRVFDVAQKQNLKIILCSPLFQGRVTAVPFSSPKMNYLTTNAAKHLQFIRSMAESSLVSTVVGTNNLEHLIQDIEVVKHSKVTKEDWDSILPMPK